MNEVTELIIAMRCRGVRLWTEGGQLHYHAVKGSLTSEDIERLRASKSAILAHLQQSSASPAAVQSQLCARSPEDPTPATYSQHKHINALRLANAASRLSIAAAVRLRGPLDTEVLRRSVNRVIDRHESLRSHLAIIDGVLSQVIATTHECDLQVIDLSGPSAAERIRRAQNWSISLTRRPVDVHVGPLFSVALIMLEPRDNVLVMAMDHVISDAASMRILWRDVLTTYTQMIQNQTPILPFMPIQFADFAAWLAKNSQAWEAAHGSYWRQHLSGSTFFDLGTSTDHTRGRKPTRCATATVSLGTQLSRQIRNFARSRQCTPAMSLLTVFAAVLLRWRGDTEVVIPFVSAGREQREVQNTIGYFGTQLYLRIALRPNDNWLDLLVRVTREYAAADMHADLGRLSATDPLPAILWNPSFNWIPAEYSMNPHSVAPHSELQSLGLVLEEFPLPQSDEATWIGGIILLLSDRHDGIAGALLYGAEHLPADVPARFADSLRDFAGRLVSNPTAKIAALQLPTAEQSPAVVASQNL